MVIAGTMTIDYQHTFPDATKSPTTSGKSKNTLEPRPEFIRLPKKGVLCRYTGLSRSALNELILPSKSNGYRPSVASYCLRRRGKLRGIRLICYDSLVAFIRDHAQQSGLHQPNPSACLE